MTEKDTYTNLDLDTAEALLIASGRPELAQALRYQAQGVRNMVQGEWGKSFVASLDAIVGKHIDPVSDQIGGLRGDTTALQAEFRSGLGNIQETVSTLAETVDGMQAQMRESQDDRRIIHEEIAALKAQLAAYIAGSKRAEV